MALDVRGHVALVCALACLSQFFGCAARRTELPTTRPAEAVFEPLNEELKKSYDTLFQIAARLEYSPAQIERMRGYLNEAKSYCTGRFADSAKLYDKSVNEAQNALKKRDTTEAERHDLHCKIQDGQSLKNQADIIAKHAIPVAYANKEAKLDLIQQWPAEERRIKQSIEDGSYKQRRWADVEDIGFRRLEPNQKDDIKLGEDSIREMKQLGMMPKEITDEAVITYVRELARKLATNSDLLVPLQVTVLDSQEVNAFALPGGFLYLERGVLESVEDESQLAGVIAHEMSHVVARHGRKLMRKATIASLFYQAAQIAAVLATGGIASIGAYYAFQYGFFGLGLALNLSLLGVSRDYEREADQLGIQYAWKAGYDPSGFTRFFDKMATKEGYVNSASWFRTHPPFYERMVGSQREMMYMGKKPEAIVDTPAFGRMKEALKPITRKAAIDAPKRPSLYEKEEGCPAASKLIYEADQPIEAICMAPQTKPAPPGERVR